MLINCLGLKGLYVNSLRNSQQLLLRIQQPRHHQEDIKPTSFGPWYSTAFWCGGAPLDRSVILVVVVDFIMTPPRGVTSFKQDPQWRFFNELLCLSHDSVVRWNRIDVWKVWKAPLSESTCANSKLIVLDLPTIVHALINQLFILDLFSVTCFQWCYHRG